MRRARMGGPAVSPRSLEKGVRAERPRRPYSKLLHRGAIGSLAGLSGNSAEGRVVRQLEAELTEHVGGLPSVTQRLLIERVIKIRWQLELFEVKLAEGSWTPHDSRTYGGLSNAFRLAIRELGVKPAKGRSAPSLDEVVTAFKKA
jgi:hypothetical protein